MPSGSSWTNPAALNQQALGDSRHSTANKSTAVGTDPVKPLEETGKTEDRDANERYDGPPSGGKTGQETSSNTSESESMLSLPAADGLDESTLDLLG